MTKDSNSSEPKELNLPEGMELVPADSFTIPIRKHLDAIDDIEYLLAGPGLTSDVYGIDALPATGKMYFLFTKDVDKVVTYFNDLDEFTAGKTREIFNAFFTCDAYVFGVLDPSTKIPQGFRQENLRPTSADCLARFTEIDDVKQLMVLKPITTPTIVGWSDLVLSKDYLKLFFMSFTQMTIKSLARMGYVLDEKLLRDIFNYRCSLQYIESTPRMWQAFLKDFPTERITQIS